MIASLVIPSSTGEELSASASAPAGRSPKSVFDLILDRHSGVQPCVHDARRFGVYRPQPQDGNLLSPEESKNLRVTVYKMFRRKHVWMWLLPLLGTSRQRMWAVDGVWQQRRRLASLFSSKMFLA